MSFSTQTCVTLICDGGCDDAFGDEDGIPHFDSEVEAFEYATSCGWHFADGLAFCSSCHAKRECARLGHDWEDWCAPESRDGITYRRRSCDRCNIQDYDPPFAVLYPKFQALRDAEQLLIEASRRVGGER